jgi:SRSO17 transposase
VITGEPRCPETGTSGSAGGRTEKDLHNRHLAARPTHPQFAKNEAGLDHYQVRDYRAWYAHITLAMLAAAYLAATRAHTSPGEKGDLQPATA